MKRKPFNLAKAQRDLRDALFLKLCAAKRIKVPVAEFRFCPTRRWRFDWAWSEQRIALEVEGGAWSNGRHVRGSGFLKDMEKYNAAAVMGFRVVRVVPGKLCDGATFALLRQLGLGI